MSGIERGNSRFSFLFKKYLNGTCSCEEAQEMVEFFEHPGYENVLMEETASHWNSENTEPNENPIPIEDKLKMDQILDCLHHRIRLYEEENSEKQSSKHTIYSLFAKAAAILILPLLVYSLYLTSKISRITRSTGDQIVWQTVRTPAGMQTDFFLPDSSHVWLNSGSEFKYPVCFTQEKRQVELSGEAFFDVVKDSSRPFLVHAGKLNIEVKGTQFNVINYPDEIFTELILKSGNVRLFSGKYEDNNTITTIKPGERAFLDTGNNKLIVEKADIDKYLAWKEGMLIFRDDRMDEVVRKLNRWFNVEIILKSPELKEYVYTATYRDETLPQILELLKISAPVAYHITDRERLSDNSYTKRKIVLTKRKKNCL